MNDPLSHSSPSPSLPQPESPDDSYTYRRYDEFSSTLQSKLPSLPAKSPCRLLLSKGKNKAAQLSPHTVALLKDDDENSSNNNNDKKSDDTNKNKSKDKDRLTVQYPKGSTYNVKMKYLLPITNENKLIIVAPETVDYRRLCIVHTPNDHSFIEIGCDFALTCGNVDTPKKLGIDKSPTSLDIARENFPTLDLEEVDVLTDSKENLMNVLERYEMNDCSKLIVAIDINGNRELDAVVQCVQRVVDLWHPRLVIVKSRSLFSLMLEKGI